MKKGKQTKKTAMNWDAVAECRKKRSGRKKIAKSRLFFGFVKSEVAEDPSMTKKVLAFIQSKKGGDIEDEELHAWAEKNGMNVHEVEDIIESMASSVLGGGKSKGKKLKVDPKELARGIKVEVEHTKDKVIAEKIARDHLAENPKYYTKLAKWEKSQGDLIWEELIKAKYIKRWKGPDGKWQYKYHDTGTTQGAVADKDAVTDLHDIIGQTIYKNAHGYTMTVGKAAYDGKASLTLKDPDGKTVESTTIDSIKSTHAGIEKLIGAIRHHHQVGAQKEEIAKKKSAQGEEDVKRARAAFVKKSLDDLAFERQVFLEELHKGRGYSVGTIRTWGGKKYKKVQSGKWQMVREGKGDTEKAGASEKGKSDYGKVAHKNGVSYFESYQMARKYAQDNNHPTDRILKYGLGWAIQKGVSGQYVDASGKGSPVTPSRLMRINDRAFDAVGAGSGGEIRENEAMAKKYADYVYKELDAMGVTSLTQKHYDKLESENNHTLNFVLGLSGYYGPERQKHDVAFAKEMDAKGSKGNGFPLNAIRNLPSNIPNSVIAAGIKKIVDYGDWQSAASERAANFLTNNRNQERLADVINKQVSYLSGAGKDEPYSKHFQHITDAIIGGFPAVVNEIRDYLASWANNIAIEASRESDVKGAQKDQSKGGSLPKVGSMITVGAKRKESVWSGIKGGDKVKIIAHDTMDGEPMLVVSTQEQLAKPDYDPKQDYHVIHAAEVRKGSKVK